MSFVNRSRAPIQSQGVLDLRKSPLRNYYRRTNKFVPSTCSPFLRLTLQSHTPTPGKGNLIPGCGQNLALFISAALSLAWCLSLLFFISFWITVDLWPGVESRMRQGCCSGLLINPRHADSCSRWKSCDQAFPDHRRRWCSSSCFNPHQWPFNKANSPNIPIS